MCVTNTTYRRSQPISLAEAQQQQQPASGCPSGLTQRLLSTFTLASAASSQQQNVGDFLAALHAPQSAEFSVDRTEKPRPKRRRKPQKPGKTAKMNDRHFVVHNYHDHSNDPIDTSPTTTDDDQGCDHAEDGATSDQQQQQHRRKGGVAIAFPLKLHAVLDQVEVDGLAHVISWQPHGRCFVIHQPKEFVDHVMPKYFRQTKLTSFQRQLNLYGFCRLTRGADASGYYHELFLRSKTHLCKHMTRTKVKGTKFKAASSPEQEPDFYTMPPVTITPMNTSDEEMSHDDSSSNPSSSANSSMPQYSFQIQQQQSFEPLPIQFLQNPQMSMPVQPPMMTMMPPLSSFSYAAEPASPAPVFSFSSWPSMAETDQVLDEAVDELFLSESSAAADELNDFVHDWDPNSDFSQTLENDKQLGYMLEKLLED